MTREELELFYSGIIEREDNLSELRADIKDAFAAFADNQGVDLSALRDGFRFHKKALKDAESARAAEFERDKLVELLIGDVDVS